MITCIELTEGSPMNPDSLESTIDLCHERIVSEAAQMGLTGEWFVVVSAETYDELGQPQTIGKCGLPVEGRANCSPSYVYIMRKQDDPGEPNPNPVSNYRPDEFSHEH